MSYSRNDARILYVTGTHGDDYGDEIGVSGLTNKWRLEHEFYIQDCEAIGVLPGPKIPRGSLPMKSWESEYPDILKPSVRVEPPPPDSFYADEEMKQMDFRLANMAYYHEQQKKLINDINEASSNVLHRSK